MARKVKILNPRKLEKVWGGVAVGTDRRDGINFQHKSVSVDMGRSQMPPPQRLDKALSKPV